MRGILKLPLLISISLLLTSCGSSHSNSQKLLNNINQELKSSYKLEHGSLVATYDLAKIHQNNCLYAKDFSKIINDDSHNKIFLNKFRLRHKKSYYLAAATANKIRQIKGLASALQARYKQKVFSNSEFQTIKTASLSKKASNEKSLRELAKLDNIIKAIPVFLPEYQPRVTSYYGMRKKHPVHGKKKFHCGIDLVSGKACGIYAAADGHVTMVTKLNGYGNIVEIKHTNNLKTRYAHLKHIEVKEGEHVIRGERIGTQGCTGHTTAEHLHFEIWLGNKHIDPFDFIAHACNC